MTSLGQPGKPTEHSKVRWYFRNNNTNIFRQVPWIGTLVLLLNRSLNPVTRTTVPTLRQICYSPIAFGGNHGKCNAYWREMVPHNISPPGFYYRKKTEIGSIGMYCRTQSGLNMVGASLSLSPCAIEQELSKYILSCSTCTRNRFHTVSLRDIGMQQILDAQRREKE